MSIKEIVNYFEIDGEVLDIKEINNGLINRSYIIYTTIQNYIIQKINNKVFTNPKLLMNNIEKVITHLNNKYKCTCENLILVSTKLGNNCLVINDEYYRCYNYVPNAVTFNKPENDLQLFEMGKVLGEFQQNLHDFNADSLYVTIKDFHDTKIRFQTLIDTFKNADTLKQQEVSELYFYIIDMEEYYDKIIVSLNNNDIPIRVVHNDTKLNNVIFNKKTKKANCLIDLDTVMPGSLLFDFGDAVRSSIATQEEDSTNYSLIDIDINRFCYFLIGYLSRMNGFITDKEIKLLVDSIFIITMEITMRFITDYLNDNQYFLVNYPKHNLDRAKNQITLAKKIFNKKEKLEKIVSSLNNRFLKYEMAS